MSVYVSVGLYHTIDEMFAQQTRLNLTNNKVVEVLS